MKNLILFKSISFYFLLQQIPHLVHESEVKIGLG